MTDVYAGSIDAPAPNRSEEMETAVLAEIMLGGRKSYEILAAEVSLDDFCNPQNRRLFEILGECAAEASADDVCFFPRQSAITATRTAPMTVCSPETPRKPVASPRCSPLPFVHRLPVRPDREAPAPPHRQAQACGLRYGCRAHVGELRLGAGAPAQGSGGAHEAP